MDLKIKIINHKLNLPLCKILKLLMLLLMLSNGPSAQGIFDCKQLNGQSNCECRFCVENLFRINCSNSNSEIVEISMPKNHNSLKLSCKNANGKAPVLPALNVGSTEIVKILFCPLAENNSFFDILEKLNLTDVKKVQYDGGNDIGNLKLSHLHFKKLQNLNYLMLNLDESITLEGDLFEDLVNLMTLELRTQQLELPATLFASLKNLTNLILAPYNATELPNEIFRNTEKLSKLVIRESNISQLQKATIEHLTSLKELFLTANALKTIEPGSFDSLTNLSMISLNFNYFEELPAELFAYTKNLQTFMLTANHVPITMMPKNLLANLPMLKEVNINCQLRQITADFFNNSTIIDTIDLAENQLQVLPESLFSTQVNLLKVDLSRNLLSEIPENLFLYNTKIRVLSIRNNQIKHITSKIFEPLTNLKTLALDNNHLTHIEANTFDSLTALTTLNLQNNRLHLNGIDARSPFKALLSLESLNLHNNSIMEMLYRKDFANAALEKLDLSLNQITVVDFNKLHSYKEINLSNNQLETILFKEDPNMSHFNLKKINLNNNRLNCDCRLLEFVQFLKSKVSKKVNIIPIKLACQSPVHLKQKQLLKILPVELFCETENCLKDCQCLEFTFKRTLSVDCRKRNANTSMLGLRPFIGKYALDDTIEAVELSLENNNLTRLPTLSFPDFDKIKTLNLAGNKLEEFTLENLPRNLKHLDLSHNIFKKINNNVLEHFVKSDLKRTLRLSGNPWQCDCELQPLLEFAEKNYETLIDRSQMQCILSNHSMVNWDTLKISDICDTDTALIIGLSILAALFILFVVIYLIYMKYNLEIKIWLYSHKMFLWLITEAELDRDKVFDAFISYSSKDEKFVVEHLVPNLENGTPPFKLCVHYRNFLVGESIPTNIANAVENSRRTIIVLSKNFLQSDWTLHEFRSAHLAALEEKKPKVIVILYGDIGNKDDVDDELQIYLKTKTYLEWNDPKFWDRLRFAMPHSNNQANRAGLSMQPIQNGYAIVNGGFK